MKTTLFNSLIIKNAGTLFDALELAIEAADDRGIAADDIELVGRTLSLVSEDLATGSRRMKIVLRKVA